MVATLSKLPFFIFFFLADREQHGDQTYTETSSPDTPGWSSSPRSPSDWSEGSPAGVVSANHLPGHGVGQHPPRSGYHVYPPQNTASAGIPAKMQVA